MDVDKFLSELDHSSQRPRSEFAIDLSRAQSKMQAHLGLEADDYACHFVQLAALLGARQVVLKAAGDWLEWAFESVPLDPHKLQSAAQGEVTMADLDLCLNFCLQCAALTHYPEKSFSSGSLQMVHQGAAGWKSAPGREGPTRLRLRLPWRSRARNWLAFDARWWMKAPELARLWPRMLASPLALQAPHPLPRPPLPFVLGVQGSQPMSDTPPCQAAQLIRLDEPKLRGSFWLAFEGHQCQVISQGLSYSVNPILTGSMWLYLGDQMTDLGRRSLVLNEEYQRVHSRFVVHLCDRLVRWVERPELVQAGFRDWLLRCLYGLADLPAGPLHQTLFQLPILPTVNDTTISLRQLDASVKSSGACYTLAESEAEKFEGPDIVKTDDSQLLDFLRQRYRALQSGNVLLEAQRRRRQRQKQWQQGPTTDLSVLDSWAYSRPIHFASWRGRLGFDPQLDHSQLELHRDGKLLLKMSRLRELGPGFYLIVEHPRVQLDANWEHPVENSDWKNLLQFLRLHQMDHLLEATQDLPQQYRRELVLRALPTAGIDLEPCLNVPLFAPEGAPASTLLQLVEDVQRDDLRTWVEAGIDLGGPLAQFLLFQVGGACLDQAMRSAQDYSAALQRWRDREPVQLSPPNELLVEVRAKDMNLLLGLTQSSPLLDFHLYRQQKSLIRLRMEPLAGFPPGLVLVADHPDFRLSPNGKDLDLECAGYRQLVNLYLQELPRLLEALLRSPQAEAQSMRLTTLQSVGRPQWPQQAPLFKRLDGVCVTAAQALASLTQGPAPRLLVNAAVSVIVEGFEECWLLSRQELAWVEEVIGGRYQDVTRQYLEAYRKSRFDSPAVAASPQPAPASPDWLHLQSFQFESLQAEAGLSTGPAQAHVCETIFVRDGRPTMRCQLFLGPAAKLQGAHQLHCRVDWPDLPFVENYGQLRSLPALKALIDWLRCYAFEPRLDYLDFQIGRIWLESRQRPVADWETSGDGTLEILLRTPFLPTVQGLSYSLHDLLAGDEVVYACEESGPVTGLRLTGERLALLQESLPGVTWRHCAEPSREEQYKLRLLAQPAQAPQLPHDTYILQGHSSEWVWGVPDRLQGRSLVSLLYQGRPAGQVSPTWDVVARAEVDLKELDLTRQGLPQLEGPLQATLDRLEAEIRLAFLDRASTTDKIRLALMYHGQGDFPLWAQALLDQPLLEGRFSLSQWWQHHSAPWPFVDEATPLPLDLGHQFLPRLPAGVVEWAQRQGLALRDCSDFARALARAEDRQSFFKRPAFEFFLEGPGYYLSSSLTLVGTSVNTVYGGLLVRQSLRNDFPPFYLEVLLTDLSASSHVPLEAFTGLWNWWSDQLQQPLETMGWLLDFDILLENTELGPEMRDQALPLQLRELARQRLDQFQEYKLREWRLLRRGLELLSPDPLKLVVQDQGPALKVSGFSHSLTVHVNSCHPSLAQRDERSQTAALLTLLSVQLIRSRSVGEVLVQLQDEFV